MINIYGTNEIIIRGRSNKICCRTCAYNNPIVPYQVREDTPNGLLVACCSKRERLRFTC